MNQMLELLLVEDNDDDAELLENMLLQADAGRIASRAKSLHEALELMACNSHYALILLDLDLPDSRGLETIMKIRDHARALPIVVLTGNDNEELSYAAIKAGAQDYLVKGKTELDMLKRTLLHSHFRFQIVHKINADSEKQRAYLATHDVLTGLPGEQVFLEQLENNIAIAEISKRTFAILILQLYETDIIERNFWVVERDKVIKKVASKLAKEKNHTMLVCRIKENVFGIIIQKIDNLESLVNYINVVQNHLNFKFTLNDRDYSPVYSIGSSIYPFDGLNVTQLLSTALASKKRAEKIGYNHYEIYNKDIEMDSNPIIFHSDILNALNRNEFLIYYQPQLNIQTNTLHGFEALIRWRHPELGIINPGFFIPIVEEHKLITALGEWIINKVCSQLKLWKANLKEQIEISIDINISIQQLESSNLYHFLKSAIKKYNIVKNEIGIELTESIFLAEPEKVVDKLHDLKRLGIKLAIDDFGKGYSSLSYLNHLPLDYLKLDLEFIKDITVSREKQFIVKSVIQLAHDLNIKIIAEGVETEKQKKWLLENGCDIIQGYLYGKPQAPEKIEKYYLEL